MSLILLCFWATEGILHPFDSSTTTTVAVALLFLPYFGVMDWKKANTLIPWGTVVLFGVGIGLGTALLQTQAAQWLANLIVQWFGLNQLAGIAILAVMAMFLVIIHLGFASATALAATMIPIIIAVMQKVQTPGISVLGMTLCCNSSSASASSCRSIRRKACWPMVPRPSSCATSCVPELSSPCSLIC